MEGQLGKLPRGFKLEREHGRKQNIASEVEKAVVYDSGEVCNAMLSCAL